MYNDAEVPRLKSVYLLYFAVNSIQLYYGQADPSYFFLALPTQKLVKINAFTFWLSFYVFSIKRYVNLLSAFLIYDY